jgi:hypothetical protein
MHVNLTASVIANPALSPPQAPHLPSPPLPPPSRPPGEEGDEFRFVFEPHSLPVEGRAVGERGEGGVRGPERRIGPEDRKTLDVGVTPMGPGVR